jgi:acetyl esterase/lipase
MKLMDRLDPELEAPLRAFPRMKISSPDDIATARKISDQMIHDMALEAPVIEGVNTEDEMIPGPAGDPDVLVRVYSPENRKELLPGLLWIHGGGYVLGSIDFDDIPMKQIAGSSGCVVVSVEYRLAPENSFPAPLNDCYAALRWMTDKSGSLGMEKSRIAVGGASAGGGLAAGLTLLARDKGEVDIAFQLLVYPMLDDRNITSSSHAIKDERLWNRDNNIFCWKAYLGGAGGGDDVSPYAVPSRADDLSGLPPAYIAVGELDLFLDEDIEYAQRLMAAGVSTELHVYPGAVHGFEGLAPMADVSRRFITERDMAIRKALYSF